MTSAYLKKMSPFLVILSELEKTRKDMEEPEETREESIINKEIPITYVPGGYQTRSKGTVHDEDWVMKKPL